MANLDSKQLLVALKAYSRANALPLDSTEVWDSMDEALNYVQQANAYAGQTIKVLVGDTYKSYNLYPTESGYELKEVGVSASDLKQYVVVDDKLPESDQEQGVIYINTADKTGSIWDGSAYVEVFKNVEAQLNEIEASIGNIETSLDEKAPIANPSFTGTVTVNGSEVAMKSYVDGLIGNLTSTVPGIVNGDNPLPTEDYKAGQTFRVSEDGTYAGAKCEVGDLIIVLKDYAKGSASNEDFMVVQANIDGAVTSSADSATVGEIVVFDAVTGKIIRGSGLTIESLNESLAKVHEHDNKDVLDSFNKTQEQILTEAQTSAQSLVDTLKETVDKKADKGTSLADYGIENAYTKAEIDASLKTIQDNLNTKVDSETVDSKISEAKTAILEEASTSAKEALEERVGAIPEGTDIKSYVDNAVGSGGTSSAQAIAQAKQEAIDTSKSYTDEQIEKALTIVEF